MFRVWNTCFWLSTYTHGHNYIYIENGVVFLSSEKSIPNVRVYREKFNTKNFLQTFSSGFFICWDYVIQFSQHFSMKNFHRHRHHHPYPVHFSKIDNIEEKHVGKMKRKLEEDNIPQGMIDFVIDNAHLNLRLYDNQFWVTSISSLIPIPVLVMHFLTWVWLMEKMSINHYGILRWFMTSPRGLSFKVI